MDKFFIYLLVIFLAINVTLCKEKEKHIKHYKEKDMMRKSIVYDKNTPDVFYCPTNKPTDINKMIVRSRPLHKLCEFEGKLLPEDYKSDCYKDLDESDYACKEKYRIMMRLNPPGSDVPFNGTRLRRFLDMDKDKMVKPSKS
uniref:Putative conserved plasma membrane protein n=1 Tax=Corethrella appendiculata TaxID=1370023 RepID=U5EP17_9DIPT